MKKISPIIKLNRLAGLALAMVAALTTSMVAQAAIGDLDPTFGAGGKVTTFVGSSNSYANAVAVQSDGKIVVAGVPLLTRYNSDGTLDTAFGMNGVVTISGINQGKGVVIQTDGKILVTGNPTNSRVEFGVARLNSNGSLDTSFGTNGIASHSIDPNSNFDPGNVRFVALQSDGKILVAGEEILVCCNVSTLFQVIRYNSNGSLDRVYENDSGNENDITALVIQPDGKILLAGNSYDGNAPGYRMAFVRLNPDFTYDSTLDGGGPLPTDFGNVGFYDYSIALQSDGKIVAVGQLGCTFSGSCPTPGYKFALARFNSNGSTDTTFGTNGMITNNFSLMADLTNDPGSEQLKNIVVQPDGKLIVGLDTFDGSHYHFLLARFNSNGSLDTSFGTNGEIATSFGTSDDHLHCIILQPDGKIIAAGSTNNGTNTGIALARYVVANVNSVTATFISEATNDGTILESAQNSNVGGAILESSQNSHVGGTLNGFATTFNVGDDPANKQYRSILSFHTASIPDNAVITSAQLKIRLQGVVGTDPFTTFGNLLVDIHSGYFGNSIGLELADFSAPASPSTYQEHLSPLPYNWYGTNLSTASNLELISKIGWTQFRLRFALATNNNKIADYDKFYSGNSPTGNQPQLIVTYYVP
ncbi:MAG: hypothetical protein WCA79_15275 [Anaerolineales bacterium]